MHVKLETKADPGYAGRDVSDWLFGFPILSTVPGSHQFIVDVPDEAGLEKLALLQSQGELVDFREAHDDYRPLGWPVFGQMAGAYVPGDQFPLMGITPSVLERGRWGAKRLGHVDTPVDAAHPFFAGKTLVRANGTNPNGEQDAHGTHTLTTAASTAGVASDAELYSYPALIGGSGSEAVVANGIRWCADQGCDVLTLSLGGSPSQVIDAAVQYARQRGVWVFSAAGNDGGNPTPGSPARASTVIVLACDRALQPASFTDGRNWPQFGNRVYGQGVYVVAGMPGGGVGTMSGTSMATPAVAGCALLLRAAGLTEAQMLAYLASHQAPVG
jgi:hypothetical protein